MQAESLKRLFLDFVSLILTYVPAVSAYLMTYWLGLFLYAYLPTWVLFFMAPVAVSLFFIALTFVFRILLPKMRPGKYKMGFNKDVFGWYCHIALNRSSKILGFRYLLNSFFTLKYLHLRSLGAKVSLDLGTSLDYVVADLPLISIGKNCTVGHNTYISCHLITGDTLFLSPVKIGDDVSIGMNCVIGPGSRIGNGCRIDFGNNIYGVRMQEKTILAGHEWMHGPPSKMHAPNEE